MHGNQGCCACMSTYFFCMLSFNNVIKLSLTRSHTILYQVCFGTWLFWNMVYLFVKSLRECMTQHTRNVLQTRKNVSSGRCEQVQRSGVCLGYFVTVN